MDDIKYRFILPEVAAMLAASQFVQVERPHGQPQQFKMITRQERAKRKARKATAKASRKRNRGK